MKYLLDTHTWLWAALGHPKLSARARSALRNIGDEETCGIAAISLKEASWLLARGRLEVAEDGPWTAWLRKAANAPGLVVLPLTVEIAIESERLPAELSDDPADRLIAATARLNDLTLVTADQSLRRCPAISTLW